MPLPAWFVLLFLTLFSPQTAPAVDNFGPYARLGFPQNLPKARLQGFLQNFVNEAYLLAFKRLGDERDFDHGHLLFSDKSGEPMAILYHTQELAFRGNFRGPLKPSARNWIQWLDETGRVENASRYVRREYPITPSWNWFKEHELPTLERFNTVTVKMLDPQLLGFGVGRSLQWTFTGFRCGLVSDKEIQDQKSGFIDIFLPKDGRVCLVLGS